jgi:hypothetical protein
MFQKVVVASFFGGLIAQNFALIARPILKSKTAPARSASS